MAEAPALYVIKNCSMIFHLLIDHDFFFFFKSTVKVVLLPVGQEIIMPFKIDSVFKYLRDHFSYLLNVPSDILQLTCAGKLGS